MGWGCLVSHPASLTTQMGQQQVKCVQARSLVSCDGSGDGWDEGKSKTYGQWWYKTVDTGCGSWCLRGGELGQVQLSKHLVACRLESWALGVRWNPATGCIIVQCGYS